MSDGESRANAQPLAISTDRPRRKRTTGKFMHKATVFDAVAGRISQQGLIRTGPPDSAKDKKDLRSLLTPDEALYYHERGPARLPGADMYWASRDLEPGSLPDSDMLKTLHEYASDFLTARGSKAYRSLDGTALLAFGILIEEMVKGVGEIGSVLVEESKETVLANEEWSKTSESDMEEQTERRSPKRRKKDKGTSEASRKKKKKTKNKGKAPLRDAQDVEPESGITD